SHVRVRLAEALAARWCHIARSAFPRRLVPTAQPSWGWWTRDHNHLNNAALSPLGPAMALSHPHNNLGIGFNKYTSLKAV
ncbi:hypothetical protein NQZ68_039830, partial [Dissostichus eleginoides]